MPNEGGNTNAGYCQLKQTASGSFMVNLKAGNHEAILTSETYTTKLGAKGGIVSVQLNPPNDDRYERKNSVHREPYFVLKSTNGETIGTSELYSSASPRD
ncbi:MAG: YegP family protein [Burkholderiales bacterium]|nr:YegP family protein [Burkholderiales bacterium]